MSKLEIAPNGRPVDPYEVPDRRAPMTRKNHALSQDEFARLACACSIARYLNKTFKLHMPTAKMLANEALKHAEQSAIDES